MNLWQIIYPLLRMLVVAALLIFFIAPRAQAETLGYSMCLDKADRILHAQRTINTSYTTRDAVINNYWKLLRAGRNDAAAEWIFAAGRIGVPKAELKEQSMIACLDGDV